MKKIDATQYEYSKLFSVNVNCETRTFSAVGRDKDGNFILNTSTEYNMGNSYSMLEEYFILNREEYLSLLETALSFGSVTKADYARLKDLY